MRPIARILYALTALSALTGLVLGIGLAVTGAYATKALEPGLFQSEGENALGRISDFAMYFTHWSNAIVVIAFGLIALRGRAPRFLLFDALLMIIVTGVVYNAILAPSSPPLHGWDLATNAFAHQITPILAVIVWAAVGPRGWLDRRLIPATLVIPIVWIVLTVIRGAVIDAYPYGFINVVHLGYAMAAVNVLAIIVLGIAICFLLIGIDRLARRWSG